MVIRLKTEVLEAFFFFRKNDHQYSELISAKPKRQQLFLTFGILLREFSHAGIEKSQVALLF